MKKSSVVILILFLMLVSGCQNKEAGENKQLESAETTQSEPEIITRSENNFVSSDQLYRIENEQFSGPDFDLLLTGSSVTEIKQITYLTIFFTFKRKTEQCETAKRIVEHHFKATQETEQKKRAKLKLVQVVLDEEKNQLQESAEKLFPLKEEAPMAITYEVLTANPVSVEFLDAAQQPIVAKKYLIDEENKKEDRMD